MQFDKNGIMSNLWIYYAFISRKDSLINLCNVCTMIALCINNLLSTIKVKYLNLTRILREIYSLNPSFLIVVRCGFRKKNILFICM